MDYLKDKIKSKVSDFTSGSSYGQIRGSLAITILNGKNLAKRDLVRNEPYVIVKVGKSEHKTSTKKGSSPAWGETLSFALDNVDEKSVVHFVAWDKDPGFDDIIGEADVTIGQLARQTGTQSIELTKSRKNCGSLLISVRFDGTGWPGHMTMGTGMGTGYTPQQQYPQQQYPQQQYPQQYGPPQQSYGGYSGPPPQQSYGGYGAPQGGYSGPPPQQSYGGYPQGGGGYPQQSYGAPPPRY